MKQWQMTAAGAAPDRWTRDAIRHSSSSHAHRGRARRGGNTGMLAFIGIPRAGVLHRRLLSPRPAPCFALMDHPSGVQHLKCREHMEKLQRVIKHNVA
ncbi:hypothetical protein BRADI_5g24415v3 [Brachypodium distachyon]|uniref:Uncharacterized protein n=1 Tax=Brachypodium distachyon TaxID=15368 RepID=A0A0Q3HA11_BRADI|nr:hypothetical protein BRADI_5g24415v3 [Brachypodium distachyon]PNT62028.1 hypothetical protein BRADI_5g24415v3 [Brachypodium distachyon]